MRKSASFAVLFAEDDGSLLFCGSSKMPGYRDVITVWKPKPELYCSQCSLLLCEALLTEEGDHMCRSCLEKLKNDGVWWVADLSYQPDAGVDEQIQMIQVQCSNSSKDCQWQGYLKDLEEHLEECSKHSNSEDHVSSNECMSQFPPNEEYESFDETTLLSPEEDVLLTMLDLSQCLMDILQHLMDIIQTKVQAGPDMSRFHRASSRVGCRYGHMSALQKCSYTHYPPHSPIPLGPLSSRVRDELSKNLAKARALCTAVKEKVCYFLEHKEQSATLGTSQPTTRVGMCFSDSPMCLCTRAMGHNVFGSMLGIPNPFGELCADPWAREMKMIRDRMKTLEQQVKIQGRRMEQLEMENQNLKSILSELQRPCVETGQDVSEPCITKFIYQECIDEICEWIDIDVMMSQLLKHRIVNTKDDIHAITHGLPSGKMNYVFSKLCGSKHGFQLFYRCLRESQSNHLGHKDAADKLEEIARKFGPGHAHQCSP